MGLTALLGLTGCGYVHVGQIPETRTITTVVGDEKLLKDNADLRLEKKILQQELNLSRAQGDALRMAIENRAADGDTSKRLVEKLNQTSRDLAALRVSYATMQKERDTAVFAAGEANALKTRLGATEEKLATSLRTYTELQEEVVRLRTDVARTRDENLALTTQVRTVTSQNDQAQAALAQLNTDLLAQKDARFRAEQDADSLRTELKAAAPNSSLLAQQRSGSAGQAHALTGDHAAENLALKQQLDLMRSKVDALESERTQLQKLLLAAASPAELAHLREENARLKNVHASQAQTLHEQLRDVQAQATALTEENNRLKSRLASTQVAGTPGAAPFAAPVASSTENPRTQMVVLAPDAPRIDLDAEGSSALKGNSSVNATLVANVPGANRAPAGKSDATGARVHVVTSGDTLAKISALYYGTTARWGDILAANRDVLGESNSLVVGRPLRIP
ncbi:MAG TPA: LysM peptidoglycan-binding domain-containing protein [Opitutaceae bacterium]|nr:LysM peptidoglycan-binding domain-containing protein [Opitutaceae bacterium]